MTTTIFNLRILYILSADKHAIRFIPRENGVHSIDVRFNGSHIPGSPFKIRVGDQSQVGDPGMVSAFGPGLEGGTTGNFTHLDTTYKQLICLRELTFILI